MKKRKNKSRRRTNSKKHIGGVFGDEEPPAPQAPRDGLFGKTVTPAPPRSSLPRRAPPPHYSLGADRDREKARDLLKRTDSASTMDGNWTHVWDDEGTDMWVNNMTDEILEAGAPPTERARDRGIAQWDGRALWAPLPLSFSNHTWWSISREKPYPLPHQSLFFHNDINTEDIFNGEYIPVHAEIISGNIVIPKEVDKKNFNLIQEFLSYNKIPLPPDVHNRLVHEDLAWRELEEGNDITEITDTDDEGEGEEAERITVTVISDDPGNREMSVRPEDKVLEEVCKAYDVVARQPKAWLPEVSFGVDMVNEGESFEELGIEDGARLELRLPERETYDFGGEVRGGVYAPGTFYINKNNHHLIIYFYNGVSSDEGQFGYSWIIQNLEEGVKPSDSTYYSTVLARYARYGMPNTMLRPKLRWDISLEEPPIEYPDLEIMGNLMPLRWFLSKGGHEVNGLELTTTPYMESGPAHRVPEDDFITLMGGRKRNSRKNKSRKNKKSKKYLRKYKK